MKKLGARVEGREVCHVRAEQTMLNAYIHFMPPGSEGQH